MDLKGKHFLITGATSGIGQKTAVYLSKLGAKLILVARSKKKLEQTLLMLEGKNHFVHQFDLLEYEEIPAMLQSIVKINGRLSGVFHAAGLSSIKPINLVKSTNIEEIFSVNIFSTIFLINSFSQNNIKTNGNCSIVLMSSVMSLKGESGFSLYSSTKGAIDAIVKSSANSLARAKIRVNSIVAGAVETGMHKRFIPRMSLESYQKYQNEHLLGFGQPDDIASAVTFLLSDASKWTTGTSMVVDGGYSCR